MLVMLCAASLAGGQPVDSATIAFVGVSVIPMDVERVVSNQTVVVRGGRIAELGPSSGVRIPAGAVRIDGRGRFLLPGLAEMHAHIPIGENVSYRDRVLLLYLAAGVTTIRGMSGAASHIDLRRDVDNGKVLGPRIYASGFPFVAGITTPGDVMARVESDRKAGYDILKILSITPDALEVLSVAARRARLRFGGHVPADVGLDRALTAGYSTVEHLDGYMDWLAGPGPHPARGYFGYALTDSFQPNRLLDIVERTRTAGTWVVPTQALPESFFGGLDVDSLARQPGMEFLPSRTVAGWVTQTRQMRETTDLSNAARFLEIRRTLIRALHLGGVGILLGSDAPQRMNVPGYSIHKELASYVRAGLTPFEALQTGTTNVARYFGTERETGLVAEGFRADLILLEGNPLERIENVERQAGVLVRGIWLDRAEIRRRIAAVPAGG